MIKCQTLSWLCGASFLAITCASTAFAQSTGSGGAAAAAQEGAENQTSLTDIIVTAQKRSERLQDVPVSVLAVTPELLTKTGADTTAALTNLVPGLNTDSSVAGFHPFLRGVGTNSASAGNENSVSVYLDNIYLASMNGGFLNLSSVESVEVLKGPQGTLFGRNATGGVIHIKTRDPSHNFGGSAMASYGDHQTGKGSLYVTGGLSDNLAADLAVFVRRQGEGYGTNLHTGNDIYKDNSFTVRSKLLFTPSPDDRLTLAVDYSKSDGSGMTYRPIPGSSLNWGGNNPALPFGGPYQFPATGGHWDIDHARDPSYTQKSGGVALTYEHNFDWATLSSFTAYRENTVDNSWSATPIPIDAQNVRWHQPENQFSQELQLSSRSSSEVKWILGLYYLQSSVKYDPFAIAGTSIAPTQVQFVMKQTIKSPAIYGQFTAPISALGDTNITGGLRYTIDKRAINGATQIVLQSTPLRYERDPANVLATVNPAVDSKTFRTFTWRLGIDHHFSRDNMIYLTYNRGFKAGSYNAIPPSPTPTNPEYLDAYEIGMKNGLFGGRATLNLAAFLYKYRDLQVTIFNQTAATTINAAKAEIKGLDIDFNAQVTDNLRFNISAEILDHKFVKYPNGPILTLLTVAQGGGVDRVFGDLSGKPLPYTSDFTFTTGLFYKIPTSVGDFDANVNFNYNKGYSFEPSDAVPRKSFVDLSGTIGYTLKNGTTRISVYGNNLTNAAVPKIVANGANPGGYAEVTYRPPRTYGVSLSQNF